MRLFEAKDLTKKYDKTVLNHLDFSIDEGEVVGIIGVSGCGKSTLARLVSGIEKPSSGSLLYQGKTVDFKKSRKDIQLILQNPIESFSPRMKIKQFLYEPYHYFYHLNKKEAMTAINKFCTTSFSLLYNCCIVPFFFTMTRRYCYNYNKSYI